MRPSNKRSRNKPNRPRTLGNIVNRVFDSSGPEGKVRGTPQQIIDKYTLLARDAQLSGDRVAAENFLQHSEHYTRMLNEAQIEMAREAEQRQGQPGSAQGGQNGNPNGGQPQNRRFDPRDDEGGGYEADPFVPARAEAPRPDQPRQEQSRYDQPRSEQPRSDAPRQNEQRQNEQRQNEPKSGEPREGRSDWKERRNKRFDERRARRETSDPRGEAPPETESMLVETPEQRAATQPAPVVAPAPVLVTPPAAAEAPVVRPPAPEATAEAPAEAAAPRPRGRPRKPRAEAPESAPAPDAAK